MTWIQRQAPETMNSAALRDDLTESQRLVVQGLPKKVQGKFGDGWK